MKRSVAAAHRACATLLRPRPTFVPLLHAAATTDHADRVKELLGLDHSDEGLLASRDARDRTPLLVAVGHLRPDSVSLLLADPRCTAAVVKAVALIPATRDTDDACTARIRSRSIDLRMLFYFGDDEPLVLAHPTSAFCPRVTQQSKSGSSLKTSFSGRQ